MLDDQTVAAHFKSVVSEAIIREAVRLLSEATPNAGRIVLFGSHARGDAGPVLGNGGHPDQHGMDLNLI